MWWASVALSHAAPVIAHPGLDCSADAEGWNCWEDGVQLRVVVRGDADPEALQRRRFAGLAQWPTGAFRPVHWAGHVGWRTHVSDGERGLISCWVVVKGWAIVLTASGPEDEVLPVAERFFAAVSQDF